MIDLKLHDRTLAHVLRTQARTWSDKPFLRYYDQAFTYAQAYENSRRVAAGLIAAGIQPRQHVAVMMENRPEAIWLHFALALMGAVVVPINNASRGDLLAYYVRQSDSVAMFIETAFIERFNAVLAECPDIRLVCVLDDGLESRTEVLAREGTRVVSWSQVASSAAREDSAGPAYDDLLQILYSSGTTGPAKGSMISNATAVRAAAKHVEFYGYDSSDVMYTCLPLFHGNAINCTVLPALVAGATVSLSRRFSTTHFWREVNESGATRTSLLSAMINFLWLKAPSAEEKTHRLKTSLVVPAPEFALEFEQRFNLRITSLYALGDFGYATMLGADEPREKIGSAGRPLPEVTVAILDEDDMPVAQGQVGQICLRSNEPWFGRQGYYNKADQWVGVTRNLWLHTGDFGSFDADGYLYFAGRSKELIRRRGENISAIQVENVLRRHPAIADAAVYAVRAEFLEDEVMASIVCREGMQVDPCELVKFSASQMAYFMVPRFISVVDGLPQTPTGKVEKYKLREAAEKQLDRFWDREKSGIVLEK